MPRYRHLSTNKLYIMKRVFTVVALLTGFIFFVSNCKENSTGTSSKKKYKVTFLVNPTDGGSISKTTGNYPAGDSLTFKATPSPNYQFSHWSGDYNDSTSSMATILVDKPKIITANFVSTQTYKFSLNIHGMGSVDIYNVDSSQTVKKDVTQSLSMDFLADTKLKLTANPSDGSKFVNWTGDIPDSVATSNPLTYSTGSASSTITAIFQKKSAAPQAVEPSGSGTQDDPYKISTVDNLVWISQNNSSWDAHFIQTSDIDASGTSNKAFNGGKGFKPIGGGGTEASPAFSGTYDGQGYEIKNLYINRPNDDEGTGLFNHMYGIVENIHLVDVNITAGHYVGGIAGDDGSGGSISNVSVSGKVSGVYRVGGVAGSCFSQSSLSKSYNTAKVHTSSNNQVGGIVGYARNCTISDVYNTGDIDGNYEIGGIIGVIAQNVTLTRSYSSGLVDNTSGKKYETYNGGIIGRNEDKKNTAIFKDNYYNSRTASTLGSDQVTGTVLTTSQMKKQSSFDGFDFSKVWSIDEGSSYPYLQSFTQNPKPGT
jgi:hypothetical protein